MYVISATERLLSMRVYECPKVAFVRRFVGREACVAVETVHAILHFKSCHARIEESDTDNGTLHTLLKLFPCL